MPPDMASVTSHTEVSLPFLANLPFSCWPIFSKPASLFHSESTSCIRLQYAVYAASAIAAGAVVAYGAWRWRQRYLRTKKLLFS